MSTKKSTLFWTVGGVLLVLGLLGAVLLLDHRSAGPAPLGIGSTTLSFASTTDVRTSAGTFAVSGSGHYTIREVPVSDGPAAPDYHAPIHFDASVSPEVRAALGSQLTQEQAALDKNPLDFNAWMQLGIVYKTAGDYAKAAAVWEYGSAEWPTNVVTFGNLGDLYQNFLHEYPKAEANYLKEIANNPTYADSYRNLFVLYTTTSYDPSPTAAEDILKKGIAANPDATDLKDLLAEYQQSHS